MAPDRALTIVQQGIGAQFDPRIAQTFLDAYHDDALTIQAEPPPLYDSFVTSILNDPHDPSELFTAHGPPT